jgi:AAA+ superfamily predicted ATPase
MKKWYDPIMSLKSLFSNPKPGNNEKSRPEPNNSPNTGSGEPNGNGDNRPLIARGDCFVKKDSGKLYQVTGFEKCLIENPDTGDKIEAPLIVYTGLAGKVFKLNIYAFLQSFQKTFTPPYPMELMRELDKKKKAGITSNGDSTENGEAPPLGNLYIPSERHTLDNMIMFPEAKEEVIIGITSIQKQEAMEKEWNLSKILDNGKQNILNFYGPSGCGKTMAARCVANFVGRKLFQVDYAQVVDKYVGETAKKISQVFATAKERGAILLFDEADSLLSKRVDMNVNSDYANSVNQNRNVLMQELDKYDDIIIMSTNFFNNYDDAMLRRINSHIEFKLPNSSMREKLFEIHIPNLEKARGLNFTKLAQATKGMSGGDIKNVCVEAIKAISCREENPEKWLLTDGELLKQIDKVKRAKEEHKKSGSNNREERPRMGFGFDKGVVELD